MKNNLLGIIGGLGPMSSAYFYELITSHTKVETDQDHLDIVLSSRASTPDRTAFILGKSNNSPLPYMIKDAKNLQQYGADELVIVCNTAHYFIDEVRKNISIPLISMIEETANYLNNNKIKKPAIMATDGTIQSNAYQEKLAKYGIDIICPNDNEQKAVMSIIYDYIKKGINPPDEMMFSIRDALLNKGAETIICGCTEISLAVKNLKDNKEFVDPLEILSHVVLKDFNKDTIGYENYSF